MGEYIKGDNDIDVAVVCSSKKLEKLVEVLTYASGFSQGIIYPENRHFLKNGILIDIIFKFNEAKMAFTEMPYSFFHKGKKYNIPNPVGSYLKFCFGDNWRIPLRKQE